MSKRPSAHICALTVLKCYEMKMLFPLGTICRESACGTAIGGAPFLHRNGILAGFFNHKKSGDAFFNFGENALHVFVGAFASG